MIKINKKINIKKEDLITYIIIFIITCIIFAPFLVGHYSTDTYNIYNKGYFEYATKYSLNDGRLFMGVIGLIASVINIPIKAYVIFTLLGGLVLSCIAVILLKNIIEKYKTPKNNIQKVIIIAISYITIFNFMYLDNLYFVESIVMALSILLFIISADTLTERKEKYILKSTILTILGILCYQGSIGMFFAYVALFSILKNKKNVKKIITDLILSGVMAIIAVAIDLLAIKIVGKVIGTEQTRFGSLSDIFNNIIYIFTTFSYLMENCCGLFPSKLFIIYFITLSAIVLLYSIKNKKYSILIQYVAVVLITIASAYVMNLTTLTSFFSGRLKNPIGALVGIIFMFVYVQTDIFEKENGLDNLVVAILASFVIINTLNYQSIIIDHKKVNKLEEKEASEIEEYIEQYEKETNIKVKKITKIPVRKKINKVYFDEVLTKSNYGENAIRTYWGCEGAVNFYTKRNLENVIITEELWKYYLEKTDFEKGYECVGDTLFINVYRI